MNIIVKQILSLILIVSILLMGCSYTPKITKPADTDDKTAWLKYYKDQFKAYGSKVTAPSDDAAEVEKTAYQEARASWVRGQIVGYIIGGVVLAIGISSLVITLSQASQL